MVHEQPNRSASTPALSLAFEDNAGKAWDTLGKKAVLLTTPRRKKVPNSAAGQQMRRSKLQPLRDADAIGTEVRSASAPTPAWQNQSGSRPSTRDGKPQSNSAFYKTLSPSKTSTVVGAGDASEGGGSTFELMRLKQRLHKLACELQETQNQLDLTQRELRQNRALYDELRLKHVNLERIERDSSSQLLEERRKNVELSKQVKTMSQNLMSMHSNMEQTSLGSTTGLQKRCFKLVQQNTALTVQARLLRRQKGWAEAKARVLQDEVTSVYLGTHNQVRHSSEVDAATEREFQNGTARSEEAPIFRLLMPLDYKHKDVVIDFLTHVTHTQGLDVHSFLEGSQVFTDAIRKDCISGMSRELYALWRHHRQLPHVLRAVERIVHLADYLSAFEGFSAEIESLLGCAKGRIWVVDDITGTLWTCIRAGDEVRTLRLQIPKNTSAKALARQGFAPAACVTQSVLNINEAPQDPRYSADGDVVGERHAKNSLCVPIIRKGKVSVVLQASNKLREPEFDIDGDARILRLLGRISMEVLQVSQTSGAQSANNKRREALLQLFNECTPLVEASQLFHVLEQGLQDVFLVRAVSLHAIEGIGLVPEHQSTAILQLDKNERIMKISSKGLKGMVGHVVKAGYHDSSPAWKLSREGSLYDSSVDLPIQEKTVVHTIPIFDNADCVAVCQFVCEERSDAVIDDDGTFSSDNTSHMRLLKLLLTFVRKHMTVVMPACHASTLMGSKEPSLQGTVKMPVGGDSSSEVDAPPMAGASDAGGSAFAGTRQVSEPVPEPSLSERPRPLGLGLDE